MLMRFTPRQCPTCQSDVSGIVEYVLAILRVVPVSSGCFEYAADLAERTQDVPWEDIADGWDNFEDSKKAPDRYEIDHSKFMEVDRHSHEPQRLRSKWWGLPTDEVQLRCDSGHTWHVRMQVM